MTRTTRYLAGLFAVLLVCTPASEASYSCATTQYLSRAHNAAYNVNNFTVGAWVNADTLGASYRAILTKSDTGSHWTFYLTYASDGTVMKLSTFIGGVQKSAYGITVPVTGTWYFVAGTYDGANVKVYNGTSPTQLTNYDGILAATGTLDTNSAAIGMGDNNVTTNWWLGKIYAPFVYGSALTLNQLKDEMVHPGANASHIALWPLAISETNPHDESTNALVLTNNSCTYSDTRPPIPALMMRTRE
jgi:hypothetical protein